MQIIFVGKRHFFTAQKVIECFTSLHRSDNKLSMWAGVFINLPKIKFQKPINDHSLIERQFFPTDDSGDTTQRRRPGSDPATTCFSNSPPRDVFSEPFSVHFLLP